MGRAAGASERRVEASHGDGVLLRRAACIPVALALLISAAGEPMARSSGIDWKADPGPARRVGGGSLRLRGQQQVLAQSPPC